MLWSSSMQPRGMRGEAAMPAVVCYRRSLAGWYRPIRCRA
jgi:hypothetical protein